jgi:hypothetical protein
LIDPNWVYRKYPSTVLYNRKHSLIGSTVADLSLVLPEVATAPLSSLDYYWWEPRSGLLVIRIFRLTVYLIGNSRSYNLHLLRTSSTLETSVILKQIAVHNRFR